MSVRGIAGNVRACVAARAVAAAIVVRHLEEQVLADPSRPQLRLQGERQPDKQPAARPELRRAD
jgi:hypothetical protein